MQLGEGLPELLSCGPQNAEHLSQIRQGLDEIPDPEFECKRCPGHPETEQFHGSRSSIWPCLWPLTMAVSVAVSHA